MGILDLFGSAKPTNDILVDYQKQEADDYARRVAEMQARRQNATDWINAIFGGGTHAPLDWAATMDAEQANKTAWEQYQDALKAWETSGTDGKWVRGAYTGDRGEFKKEWVPGTPQGPKPVLAEGVVDPENWNPLDNAVYGEAQTYGGIGDDFYDAYRNSILDYYTPQLNRNYRDASGQTMLDFARKGTRKSSAAGEAQGDLRRNYDLQYGAMVGDADAQTAQMRNKVDAEKYGLLQLAATAENPTSAVNQALTEVNAVQTAPSLSPLGDLFGAAAIGYNSYQQAKDRQAFYNAYNQPGTGRPASAGKVYGG